MAIWLDLIMNLALLVALSVVSGFIDLRWPRATRPGVLLQGALFGAATLFVMLRPLNMGEGLIFDGRTVMISLCALYFGPRAACVAIAMPLVYRLQMGGDGVIMGVSTIAASAIIGLWVRGRRRPEEHPPSTSALYLLGLAVHLAMVALMTTLPRELILFTMARIGPPVLLLYPLATILAGKILSDQLRTQRFIGDLQRARENLAVTLQSIGDAVISTDREGRVALMNPVAESLTGWKSEDARNRPLAEVLCLIDAQTRTPLANPAQRSLPDNIPNGIPEGTLLVACDGTERRIADSIAPIHDGQGNTIGQAIVFRDETEEYRAREAMRDREAFLRILLETVPVPVFYKDRECRYLGFNRAFEAFFGKNREEMIGKTVFEISAPEAAAVNHEKDHQLLSEPGTVVYEHYSIDARGRQHDVIFHKATLTNQHGEAIGIIGAVLDITERRQAEEALRATEAKLQAMIANIADVIAIMDRDSVIRYKSPNIERWFGWRPEEIIGAKAWDNLHPDDQEAAQKAYASIFDTPDATRSGECRYRCKNGAYKWAEYTVINLLHDPTIQGILLNYHDISERKQADETRKKLEDQLRQAQKIESIGRLAGGVAHDFNNMLSVILGHAEFALEQTAPDSLIHKDLEEIQKAGRRSAELTRQLLAFARRQTIAPRTLNLNKTIEGMLRMLRRLIGEDIDLVWVPDANLWPVRMDPGQVDQILANLCVNARDAIHGVGKVTIETTNVTLDTDYCATHAGFEPGQYVRLAVSDNGHGMDRETLKHIFEPFFTTKGVGEGVGLGLATVYGIVHQNNGFLHVHSEPDQGTTFHIFLAGHFEPPATPKSEQPSTAPCRGNGETVLVVEDEKTILQMTKRFLEGLGYRVLAASSPHEAIDLSASHAGPIHLLVTDVVMPEMNGRALARMLLADHPKLRILFMSGYTADVIGPHGVLDPGVRFIQKPFSLHDLAAKAHEALT